MSCCTHSGHILPTSVAKHKRLGAPSQLAAVRPRLHCSQNRHNTAVWTDSRQGSRYQPHYSLCQRLHWNRYDWNVISQQRPTVWCHQSGLLSNRQSGQTPAAVCIGFECCCYGQNVSNIVELVRDVPPLGTKQSKIAVTEISNQNFGIGEKLNVAGKR